ncbi:MAG: RrF2 family transcriptional regulator [Candidatus Angelobacter sp.]
MITKTSLLAIRALVCVAEAEQGVAVSPRTIATRLGESPAYMAKVLRSLVKAGILRSEHGRRGGVLLNRRPSDVTLLAIVEACQGAIAGTYCQGIEDLQTTCAYHKAAVELQHGIVKVLSCWHLEQLAASPRPIKRLPGETHCMMVGFPVSIPVAGPGPRLKKKTRVR